MNKEDFARDFHNIACLATGVEMIDRGRIILKGIFEDELLRDLNSIVDKLLKKGETSINEIQDRWVSEK